MKNNHFVITIGRQYGSGGRIVGKMLAEELGIHFYDEEILKLTSETSAIGEQYFRLADEKAGNNLLYRMVKEMKPDLDLPKSEGNLTKPENLFRFQSNLIRRLAAEYGLKLSGGSDFHGSNKPHIRLGKGKGSLAVPYEFLDGLRQ